MEKMTLKDTVLKLTADKKYKAIREVMSVMNAFDIAGNIRAAAG